MTTPAATVLVVDDERPLRRFLRAALEGHGYRVVEAERGTEALTLVASHSPDAVILDLGLPDLDGLEVTRRVREWSEVPIIVVSARGQVEDKVRALDLGANDYLTKPFSADELLARLRVSLRSRKNEPTVERIDLGALTIDLPRHEVRRDGALISLTPTEFRLLTVLARNAGKVLTHRQLLSEVLGSNNEAQVHTVRVHLAELRKKLERDPTRPKWLVTETGIGYRLRERLD